MTKDKQDLMETETSQEQLIEKAALEINTMHKNEVIMAIDVQNKWNLSQHNAVKALKRAGFAKVKKRWEGKPPVNGWVQKENLVNGTCDSLSLF